MAAKKAPKKETMGPPAPPPKKPSAGARAFGAHTAIFVPPELQHEGPKPKPPPKQSVVVKVPKRTESTSEKRKRLASETAARERMRVGLHIKSSTGVNDTSAVPDYHLPPSKRIKILGGHASIPRFLPGGISTEMLGHLAEGVGKSAYNYGAGDLYHDVDRVGKAIGKQLTPSFDSKTWEVSTPATDWLASGDAIDFALGKALPNLFERTAKQIAHDPLSPITHPLRNAVGPRELGNISAGVFFLLPLGKLGSVLKASRAAKAAGKIGEALPDSEARTAWKSMYAQRFGEAKAEDLIRVSDNLARNLHPENPHAFYEKTVPSADNAADFLKTPGAKNALFQTEAGPRRGIVELAQGAARWAPNPNGEFIPGAGDMVQAGQHGVGLIDDIHGDTANIILESGKEITHPADDLLSVVPDPTNEVPVFYSPLQRKVAADIPEQGLTKTETIKTLAPPKSPGPTSTKLAEWEDSGMKDFVDGYAANEVIPKQDILAHLATSLNAYNVDEVIRSSNSTAHGAKFGERTFGALTVRDSTEAEPYFEITMKLRTPIHQRVRKSVMGGGRREAAPYTGKGLSHWGESDVIVHVRFHVITDNEGKTALLVDEIQSDWASQHREFSRLGGKEGIEERLPKLERELEIVTQDVEQIQHEGGNEVDLWELQDQMRELDAERTHLKNLLNDVPGPAPLGKKQVEAAVRRTIRYAHDAGVERIIIVRGDVQAIRNAAYEVTPKGRKVKLYDPLLDEETGSVEAQIWKEDTAGMTHEEVKAYANDPKHKESGPAKTFMRLYGDDTQKGDIPEVFEKEMGEKGRVIKGIFDGGYADQQVSIRRTASADKVFEGKVYEIDPEREYGQMPTAGDMVGHEEGVGEFVKMAPNRRAVVRFGDGERQVWLDDLDVMRVAEGAPQGVKPMDGFVIEMTEGAKAKAAQPMSLYQKGRNPADLPKGATELFADGTQAIHLFETADVSTVIHELAHVALADINEVDRAVLGRHFDFATEAGNEAYARALERYLYDGMAMESELDGIFAKIKTWMHGVYQHVNQIGAHVHPEVKQVFDRMMVKPETPEQQLVRLLKGAPKVRKAQEVGYSEERGRRAAAMMENWDEDADLDGFFSALSELHGELPKEEFTALQELTPEAVHAIVKSIRKSPLVLPFEKGKAVLAVVKATEGEVPTNSELALLEKIFGKAVGFRKVRGKTPGQIFVEIWNIPRSFSATGDLSGLLRQNFTALMQHPVITIRNTPTMIRALKVKNYEEIQRSIHTHPNYPKMSRGGLAVDTSASDPMYANREDSYFSSYADHIPGIKHAGNSYSGLLHSQRADIFNHMLASAEQKNIKRAAKGKRLIPVNDPQFWEGVSIYANGLTGRGTMLNNEFIDLEKHAPLMNTIFFSPRLFASRVNMVSPAYFYKLYKYDPWIAKQQMIASFRTVAQTVAVLAIADISMDGVSVGVDPTSANFGKIRVGDTRIDMLAGFSPLLVLLSRLVMMKTTSSSSGKVTELTGGFGGQSPKDIIYRFGESKFAPMTAIIKDISDRETFIGDPVTWRSEGKNFIPMMWRDAWDIQKTQPDPTMKVVAGTAAAIFGGLGIGLTTYPDKAPSSGGGGGGGGSEGGMPEGWGDTGGGGLPEGYEDGGGGGLPEGW